MFYLERLKVMKTVVDRCEEETRKNVLHRLLEAITDRLERGDTHTITLYTLSHYIHTIRYCTDGLTWRL